MGALGGRPNRDTPRDRSRKCGVDAYLMDALADTDAD